MRGSIRRHPFLVTAFALALTLAFLFAFRLLMWALFWPPSADGPIEGWMTVGYVAQTWDVPREVLAEAVGIEPGAHPRQSLSRIAEERRESLEAVIARLDAAVSLHHGDGHD